MMQSFYIIGAPALKAFIDARAKGASPELLTKLGDAAMAEQKEHHAKTERRLRLVCDGGNNIENPTPDVAG
jgi:hypothetical protein